MINSVANYSGFETVHKGRNYNFLNSDLAVANYRKNFLLIVVKWNQRLLLFLETPVYFCMWEAGISFHTELKRGRYIC